MEMERRLTAALSVAEDAKRFLLEHEKMRFLVETKAENDYVTAADRTVEEMIRDGLKARFPSDGWYGEESGMSGDEKRRWIVDPVDGTVDFMWSFPLYTISIAYEDEEGTALGVVVFPRQDEVFYAIRGKGAFLDGKRLEVRNDTETGKTLAVLVPPHRRHEYLDEYLVKMRRFYDHFSDMRSIGSAAASICYIASGRCSIYYEEFLHIYDIAAAELVLREAGGRVSIRRKDEEYIDVLASSASVHELGLELIDGKGSFI